jgi:DNA-binding NarL/FixJ family response regulator
LVLKGSIETPVGKLWGKREAALRRLRLLVVDDHPLMVEAISLALGTDGDFEIVAVATSGADIVPLVRRTTPDLVLLDLRMPAVDGMGALRALREAGLETKVIVLSGLEEPELVDRALRSGACAFIMKRIDPVDLGAAIRQALDQTLFHPLRENPLAAGANGSEKELNKRELAILNAVGAGLSNKQIAEREWLAEQTVKFHLTHIYKKLGVSSRAGAVAIACQRGLIDEFFEPHRQQTPAEPVRS